MNFNVGDIVVLDDKNELLLERGTDENFAGVSLYVKRWSHTLNKYEVALMYGNSPYIFSDDLPNMPLQRLLYVKPDVLRSNISRVIHVN